MAKGLLDRRGLAVVLLCALSGCDSRSALQRSAEAAAARRGLTLEASAEVDGVHERAVCGTAGGEQAIYREDANRLMLQSDFEPQIWSALYRNWCG